MTADRRDRGGDGSPRLGLYDDVAQQAAALVIRRYSTSFGMASRLLGARVRPHVEAIYALVRVADEIVDGAATEAGLGRDGAERLLDGLETQTDRAVTEGYGSDLVVHAFARTARFAGFGRDLTAPFFASMRTDLHESSHDAESLARYIYGSAEVVGLMCLRVFLADDRAHSGPARGEAERAELENGARALGAAFQKVNFLRDLHADAQVLGRSYFPGVDPATFGEDDKVRLLDDIDTDLAVAARAIPRLPANSRRAVALAHGLFAELSRRLRATPAPALLVSRVRVPDPVKLRIAAVAALR
ncbi:squalene/phytoene synthase family protein [Pseudolysinimonas kribbensis]|uniref:Phytoene synthase n=1 Tax=Pseudolysinimonas kribbensis TaxID=433641 RepID=A0ABQ6K469_9MICO|nr:squalene/phytoene synthase family protein [Pseudolysinimonas kribbensis]GMA95228.1 phytoene synthase [Pseudolysinimonas kribbensis]